ncbi:PilZ domain-containing protein [Candidatus Electronema sp. JM]|uniref:PilZ domain-containing protein n=1 Tax=Candidatus Electronema sp. JM TaxID=3401571 RepID=UPI003AA96279
MTACQLEKRRHHRIIFKDPKKIAALISPFEDNNAEEAVAASILNMSEGGMQISVERSSLDGIFRGRKIMLHCISGLPDINAFTDVPMQVVWVMDNEYLDHVLVGVAFDQLSKQQEECLRMSVDICLQHNC